MAEKRCFVVMGYGVRRNVSTGKKIDLDKVYVEIIKPVVTACGYECIRGDEVFDSRLIEESMYYGILESDLVVADISTLNPNAIYELGVRHGVRKFRTVIMMENSDQFFFDLNHIRTITYTYYSKKKKFDAEASLVRDRLNKVIQAIENEEQIDSPLYRFIGDLQEPQKTGSSSYISKQGKPLYERIREAVGLKNKENYAAAFPLFESLATDIPYDPFFKQQMALCTYKQANPSTLELLDKAYSILEPLADTIDPETNGLIGAIYKRRFEITNAQEDIDRSINAYRKAYGIYADNYNGENYAFCLLLKSSICHDETEKNELTVVSKHVYREVYERYKDFDEKEVNTEYELWVIASLAACAKVLKLQESYGKFESFFLSKSTSMMISSYKEQMEKLDKLLKE